ncbi:DNA-3-methyladenine glycosylase I [Microbacterium sp. NPDC091382]|uniref:DNA-3-methyladenine glycosylase I n=1 Tax=Microbacterium sp. NPDC091382 TaxID=3364210 RepID=UPI003817028B
MDTRLGPDGLLRCGWVGDDAEYRRYHDEEWGRPLHGDRALFEKMSLEGFQAGLSWITILRKRPRFREVFAAFEPEAVAAFDESDVERLMGDAGIIRNRAKILATIGNARLVTEMEPAELDAFMWSFAPASHRRPSSFAEVPATTPESDAMSKALRKRGFRFVGSTTMYALMQSSGMVDDHVVGCHRAESSSSEGSASGGPLSGGSRSRDHVETTAEG